MTVKGRSSLDTNILVRRRTRSGCSAILSEDMRDGRRLSGAEFINPFATDAAARLEPLPEP